MKSCSIAGCSGAHIAKGFCNKHYKKLCTYGSPLAGYEERSPKGSGNIRQDGYRRFFRNGAEKLEHVAVAEQLIGKPLPKGAVIHHVNGNKLDNRPENLVVCPSHAYHVLIHTRQNALNACGVAHWRKCNVCYRYDDPANLYISTRFTTVVHTECARKAKAQRRLLAATRKGKK